MNIAAWWGRGAGTPRALHPALVLSASRLARQRGTWLPGPIPTPWVFLEARQGCKLWRLLDPVGLTPSCPPGAFSSVPGVLVGRLWGQAGAGGCQGQGGLQLVVPLQQILAWG